MRKFGLICLYVVEEVPNLCIGRHHWMDSSRTNSETNLFISKEFKEGDFDRKASVWLNIPLCRWGHPPLALNEIIGQLVLGLTLKVIYLTDNHS